MTRVPFGGQIPEADAGARSRRNDRKRQKTVFMIFRDQIRDVMIPVLIATAAISPIIGVASATMVIIVIIVLIAVIGFVQEFRVEKAGKCRRPMEQYV